jgi:hypothetical protein
MSTKRRHYAACLVWRIVEYTTLQHIEGLFAYFHVDTVLCRLRPHYHYQEYDAMEASWSDQSSRTTCHACNYPASRLIVTARSVKRDRHDAAPDIHIVDRRGWRIWRRQINGAHMAG